MANSLDPDEMPLSAASHLGLHCLFKPVCHNTYGKYGACFLWGSEKNVNIFSCKNLATDKISFLFLHESICYGYSLEAPRPQPTTYVFVEK